MHRLMNHKHSLAVMTAMVTALAAAAATTVDCRPGALHSLVGNPASVTSLRLTGTADASDFFFMASAMPALTELDLAGCDIAAYRGDAINGLSAYPALTIPQGAFAGTGLKAVILPDAKGLAIGDFAFAGSALETVSLPAGTAVIGQGAFAGCRALTSATLTAGARSAGYAFNNCPALVSVDLAGATSTGTADYAGCTALSAVKGTRSATRIADSTFNGCSSLTEFDFGPGLRSIGSSAFAGTSLVSARFRDSAVDSIGSWAFAYNPALTDVATPAGTGHIGEGAFFDCPSLKYFTLPSGLRRIEAYTLKGASSVETLTVPRGVDEIGAYALKGASGTRTVRLPSTLEYIGDGAMEGMTGLTAIEAAALEQAPELGADVWKSVPQADVRLDVYIGAAPAFEADAQWSRFDINPVATLVGETSPEAAHSTVRCRFSGSILLVEAPGRDIAEVVLFDVAGRAMLRAVSGEGTVAIDTSAFTTDIYIVRCTLSGGDTATFKTARRHG